MAFKVQDIRSQLEGGGARPTLFQVTNIAGGGFDAEGAAKLPFMVKAAQLPGSTLGTIEVPYFGRKIKIAGDRTFAEWTVTVINDEDFKIRNAMEAWSANINQHVGNKGAYLFTEDYKAEAQIVQYAKSGAVLREYTFTGLFPSEISPVEVSWETVDAIEEFTVTLQYDWWSVTGGITGLVTA